MLPLAVVIAMGLSCRSQQATTSAESAAAEAQPPGGGAIGSLGRIEPGDGIVRIASRSLSGQPSIVARLMVKEGDTVRRGQLIAELDSKSQLDATVRQASARIEVARRRLAQVQAGPKGSDVAAQKAEIERLQGDAANAEKEYQRYASLGANVTALELDRLRLRIDSSTRLLSSAEQRLASLNEVRDVDVALAQAELDEAISNAARARAEYDASSVYSPIDGRVVRVHAWPGETVGADGLMELAPTEPMYAVAEVAESDIVRVKVGQRATISGEGLAGPLQGSVERIGAKVLDNQLMAVDPASFSDSRVVEVWVKIDDSRAVVDLINLRVNVVIQP
jgi:HlyD family secretion protein